MTSATEKLRRLLDERRVEWTAEESEIDHVTTWNVNGGHAEFYESKTTNPDLLQVSYHYCTPKQAIAATLGPGTCHDDGDPSDFCCSECGVRMFTNTSDTYTMIAADEHTIIKHPNYCPNCGRKVVA